MYPTRLTDLPRVTVCVATRNHGAAILPTLYSLAKLDHDSFEVVVVDQSADDLTAHAFQEAAGFDGRFSYLHSPGEGKSKSLNLALCRARGVIMAFTDDDCVVPPPWLSSMESALARHPTAAMICGGITAPPHDSSDYLTIFYTPPTPQLYRSRWQAHRSIGMGGANLIFRTAALQEAGGFDEFLGVGAPLVAGEDFDMMYRLLVHGYEVLVLPEPAVVHYEFKDLAHEAPRLLSGYALSVGAVSMKHLRCGDPAALYCLVMLWFRMIAWGKLLRLRPQTGVRRFVACALGQALSFRYRVDGASRRYWLEARPEPQNLADLP